VLFRSADIRYTIVAAVIGCFELDRLHDSINWRATPSCEQRFKALVSQSRNSKVSPWNTYAVTGRYEQVRAGVICLTAYVPYRYIINTVAYTTLRQITPRPMCVYCVLRICSIYRTGGNVPTQPKVKADRSVSWWRTCLCTTSDRSELLALCCCNL